MADVVETERELDDGWLEVRVTLKPQVALFVRRAADAHGVSPAEYLARLANQQRAAEPAMTWDPGLSGKGAPGTAMRR